MRLRQTLLPLLASAARLSCSSAEAAFTVYTTQASFLAAISNPGTDTFNDLNPTAALATPLDRIAGAYSYTASAGPASNFYPAGTATTDAWLATNNRTDTITFSGLSSNVRGIGAQFFGSDASGLFTTLSATLTVSAVDASGAVSRTLVDPSTTSFLGFVSTGQIATLSVWVGAQNVGTQGVWPTVNNLTLGVSPVPEPGTVALLLLGLVGVAFVSRGTTKA